MQTLCLFVKLCCNLRRISALCTHDKRESFLKSNRVFNHPFVPNSSHFLHLTDVPYESKVALAYLKPCGLSVYTWCQIATNYACCKLNNHANTVIFLSLENESAVFSSLSVKLKKQSTYVCTILHCSLKINASFNIRINILTFSKSPKKLET